MRELQACDFCGGDPAGVYEPLPASVAADQPRVALCDGCRDTLQRVLAPLDADSAATPDRDATADATDAAPTADSTDDAVTVDQPATDAGDAADEPAAAERPPEYAQVLRLVRNRDEPLARDDLEALASSAYGMAASDVQRAVDAAVDNGDLQETDRGLRAD